MILPIVQYPDPLLTKISEPVDKIDDELRRFAADMADTMYDAEGVGLAAIQVGRPIRLIVVDISGPEKREALNCYVNPVLTVLPDAEEEEGEEGCLSVPYQYRSKVWRPNRVLLEATDLDEKPVRLEAEGFLAVCLQHECDHLQGTLFLDHLSHLKRSMYAARVKKRQVRKGE